MKNVQHEEIKNAFHNAKGKAVTRGQSSLLTIVKEVEHIDPLLFYSLKQEQGNRFFWYNALEKESVVGIGVCREIDVETMGEASVTLLREGETVLLNVEEKVTPVLFGGFSFDERKGSLWKGFKGGTFQLPTFSYVYRNNHSYFMMNMNVTEETEIEEVMMAFREMEKQLQENYHLLLQNPVITAKQETRKEEWIECVRSILTHIHQKDVEKVVLAREMIVTAVEAIDSVAVLRNLQMEQHNCCIFALQQQGRCFLGATPERLIKVEDNHFSTMALAGTIQKGETEASDERNRQLLLHDEKNLKEHQIVVEMIIHSLQALGLAVSHGKKPAILKTKYLHHLYTPIYGELDKQITIVELIKALHPTPALGGFPKQKAGELIAQYEPLERGWYGAPIGWIDGEGNGDFAVGIRSALLIGNEAHLFAGCGIVVDSIPELELEETAIKFMPMLRALKG